MSVAAEARAEVGGAAQCRVCKFQVARGEGGGKRTAAFTGTRIVIFQRRHLHFKPLNA